MLNKRIKIPTTHAVKLMPEIFEKCIREINEIQLSSTSRMFGVGNWIILKEYSEHHTGREIFGKITDVEFLDHNQVLVSFRRYSVDTRYETKLSYKRRL